MQIRGIVIEGQKHARTLGFPTINIRCDEGIESGIYCGTVMFDGVTYTATLFKREKTNIFEAHLIDFSGNVYGKEIVVTVGKKIREVEKFTHDEDLKRQIAKDIVLCSQES